MSRFTLTLALLLGQDGIRLRDQGGVSKVVRELNCVGPGVACSATSTFGTLYVDAGAGIRAVSPIYIDAGHVNCALAAENAAGCIAGNAAAIQDLSGIFVFKQRLATRGGTTYDVPASLYASMDVSQGLAVDGPVFPNTDGNQLRLVGRRTDGVANVKVGAAHWRDGGILLEVNFPTPCDNSAPMLAVTNEAIYFGADVDRNCSGTGNLLMGSLVDNTGTSGHLSMRAGAPQSLTLAGNLSANKTAIQVDGGKPDAAGYPAGRVGTHADGGTYFYYSGSHGSVIATSVEEMHQGVQFQVDNPDRPTGTHLFVVTYWGSFAQEDQIALSDFPPASSAGVQVSEGQYRYGYFGELAHDRPIDGNPSTGHWRNRHSYADGGQEWVQMIDTSSFKSGTCTLDGASPSKCSVTLPADGATCSCSGKGTSAAVANAGCAWNVVGRVATFYSSNGLTHDVGYTCN